MRPGAYPPVGVDVGIAGGHTVGGDAVQHRPGSRLIPIGELHGAAIGSLYGLQQVVPAIEVVGADVVGEGEEVAVRVFDTGHEVGAELLVGGYGSLLVEDVFPAVRGYDDKAAVALVHRPGQAAADPALLGDEGVVLAVAVGQDLPGAVRQFEDGIQVGGHLVADLATAVVVRLVQVGIGLGNPEPAEVQVPAGAEWRAFPVAIAVGALVVGDTLVVAQDFDVQAAVARYQQVPDEDFQCTGERIDAVDLLFSRVVAVRCIAGVLVGAHCRCVEVLIGRECLGGQGGQCEKQACQVLGQVLDHGGSPWRSGTPGMSQ
ncbi:hypothetical protein D3C85_1172230 [compost metagenome]